MKYRLIAMLASAVLEAELATTALPASAAVLPGDLNRDSIVSTADAVLLARLVAEDETLSLNADAMDAADFDGDGLLTMLDVMRVLQKVSEQRLTIGGYTIEDAMNSLYAASLFNNSLRGSLMKSAGGLLHIPMPYGENGEMIDTFCGSECTWLFVALNHNYASEKIYSGFSKSDIDINASDFKTFIYNFGYVQSITGNDIDFTKYTYDIETGRFLNKAQQAWRSGSFDDFMQEYYVRQKMSEECLNNPGVMCILCSYDTERKYLNEADIDERLLNPFINHICESSAGHPYILPED